MNKQALGATMGTILVAVLWFAAAVAWGPGIAFGLPLALLVAFIIVVVIYHFWKDLLG